MCECKEIDLIYICTDWLTHTDSAVYALQQGLSLIHISVFPNGNEGWAEVRRTDYPRYLLAPVNGNNSNGEVASGKLIKRINLSLIHISERTYNQSFQS